MEWTTLPLVPLMVNTKVPRGVLDLVLTVIVDVPPPFTDAGLKLAVVREGKPLTLKLTAPEKPFKGVTVTV